MKQELVFERAALKRVGMKLTANGAWPHLEVVAHLTPKTADVLGVRSTIFNMKTGEIKPGVRKSDLDYEGSECLLTMQPNASRSIDAGSKLKLYVTGRKLHKVCVQRTGGQNGKPRVALVRFQIDLPTTGDIEAVMNPFVFAMHAGGAELSAVVSFQVIDQAHLFDQKADPKAEKPPKPEKPKPGKPAKKKAGKVTIN